MNTYNKLNILIQDLYTCNDKEDSLEIAILIANEFMRILFPEGYKTEKWGTELLEGEDALGKIIPVNDFPNSKVQNWFNKHPFFGGERTALKHFFNEDCIIESKFYWLNKSSTKTRITAGVMITPNWEDGELYKFSNYKLGIDFFLSDDTNSLYVVVSNNGKVRVMELNEKLSNTQINILNSIDGICGLKDINEDDAHIAVHTSLWNAFALKEVNKHFYKGVSNHFNVLLQHLVDNDNRNEEEAKLFVNRLIGRLLFVWFLRKKSFINTKIDYFCCDKFDAKDYYKKYIKPLFFNTLNIDSKDRSIQVDGVIDYITPYLNGGLFEPQKTDWIDEEVSFPKNWFISLFGHFDEFNFTTDESTPEYEQVAIDPEMLGRVFENLLASQLDESGQEARKASGSFYTPREIVSSMCKDAIRNYLKNGLNNKKLNKGIDDLLDTSDMNFELNHSNSKKYLWGKERTKEVSEKVINLLNKITVLDPACGSGAFPMGMVQQITKIYERLNFTDDIYNIKYNILKNNIFGVDIQPMAVEIARLRVWLSMIVDEDNAKSVKPLPNLDFKFVCANSLVPLKEESGQISLFQCSGEESKKEARLSQLRSDYFATTNVKEKEKIREEYKYEIFNFTDGYEDMNKRSERFEQIKTWNPFKLMGNAEFFDSEQMFGIHEGFDIVIGNPPYISTKGVNQAEKNKHIEIYGFTDDFYNLFTFRGMELLKNGGTLNYIVPKTFWTISTKRNMRDLLLSYSVKYIKDTANPFESAMVDTCVIQVEKTKYNGDNNIKYFDCTKDLANPDEYDILQDMYINSQNSVIFIPDDFNLRVCNNLGKKVRKLHDLWWDRIRTSKEIEKNNLMLNEYRSSLKSGDITLLGCLTEGGQGLATANNGKYLAVRNSTKWADNIKKTRFKKLNDFVNANAISLSELCAYSSVSELLSKGEESEIADVFETLKEKYGRDIFGQGYIYRIINDDEIANVNILSEDEKLNGISSKKRYFVPYDKGDKDGNRWYLDTPFAIAWSQENVQYLKTDSRARYQGFKFFFKEGFCWTLLLNEFSEYQKARIKDKTVNDVNAMALYPYENSKHLLKYFVVLLNSYFIFKYKKNFLSRNAAFQINDARQLPVIIPSDDQLREINEIFDRAYDLKKRQINGCSSVNDVTDKLDNIQNEVDRIINKLYKI